MNDELTNKQRNMIRVMEWAEARSADGYWVDIAWSDDCSECVSKIGKSEAGGELSRFHRKTELDARLALIEALEAWNE